MAVRVSHTTIDCLDAYEVSEWWERVLDDTDIPGDPNEIHLDPAPRDRTRDEEIERALGLGAREVADLRQPDGSGWMVLEDPVGNRFCIVRSDAERATQGR